MVAAHFFKHISIVLLNDATQSVDAYSQDVFVRALVILAATASIVVASVSRQENLSNRTRTLTKEFRDLLDKEKPTIVDRERLINLPDQIFAFRRRLHYCVIGHICLYFALTIEAVGFGFVFLKELLHDLAVNQVALANVAIVVAFLLVAAGIFSHIVEYLSSDKTIDMEVADIREYAKSVRGDIDGFLQKLQGCSSKTDDERQTKLPSPHK